MLCRNISGYCLSGKAASYCCRLKKHKGRPHSICRARLKVPDEVLSKAVIKAFKASQQSKFVDGCGLKTVLITGGAEATVYSVGSFHGKDLAIDVAEKKFNKLTDEQASVAAKDAGFTHDIYEDFKGAGNGLGDKHKLSNSKLLTKVY